MITVKFLPAHVAHQKSRATRIRRMESGVRGWLLHIGRRINDAIKRGDDYAVCFFMDGGLAYYILVKAELEKQGYSVAKWKESAFGYSFTVRWD